MSKPLPQPIRVMLVDDHEVVRKGLASLIQREPDFVVCGEASNRAETLDGMDRFKPHVIVMDLALHGESGLELLKDALRRSTGIRVLVLSMLDELVYAPRCFQAGAMGYVMKEQGPRYLIDALRTIAGGEMVVSARVSRLLARRLAGQTHPGEPSLEERLTDRELSVFERIGQGFSLNEIAEQLGISPKTVESYRERIKHKLGVDSAHALQQQAIERFRERAP